MKILSIDLETSGTDPNRHAPTSIGCAVMEGQKVLAECEYGIGPTLHWKSQKIEREYDVRALEVQGASWVKIKASPLPKVIVGHLQKFAKDNGCGELPIVAYNAPFDIGFYSTLLFLASDWHPTEKGKKVQPEPPFVGPWHCALMLARRSLRLDDYCLDSVAAHFGLSRTGESHGALEDAVLAGRVFHLLTEASSGAVPGLTKQHPSAPQVGAAPLEETEDDLERHRRLIG